MLGERLWWFPEHWLVTTTLERSKCLLVVMAIIQRADSKQMRSKIFATQVDQKLLGLIPRQDCFYLKFF